MGAVLWGLAVPMLLGATQDDLPAGWKTIAPKDAGYSVALPGTPSEKKQQVKTATGILHVVMQVAEGRGDTTYVVSHCDFPAADLKKADIDKRLDQARDGAIASARGKKRSEEPIKLAGHPGRDITIEKDGEAVARMRIFVVNNRLYQVMVLGNGPALASKETSAFLDSFRLTE